MNSGLSQKPSILIVEDERIVAMDLQQTLGNMGYDAFATASSGDEAIARVSERCPDIVLMDIRIKGARDGIQIAGILKESFDLGVIYLTAHADEATLQRAKMTGPFGYLLKPVRSAELRSSIEVALFKHAMEKRLREREQWFSAALRSIADAVITVDVGGKVTFMNPAAEGLIGLACDEVTGKHVRDVLRLVDARSTRRGETPPEAALRTMKPVQLHDACLLNSTTGEERLIDDSTAPVMYEQATLGAVMVFRDVTEQKMLQRRVEFADRLSALGTMAAGTAHELNNPLAVVIGNTALLAADLKRYRTDLATEKAPERAEQRLDQMANALGDVQSAASRMRSIVSDLQAFSRPTQDGFGLVDLTQCVEWAIRSTAHEFQHRARLLTQFGDVPLVEAEEGRLGQVFINLLVNAVQAMPPGDGERNEVSVTTYTDGGGCAVVEIRDTGAGIPAEVRDRIFDPFFTTKGEGTGTGLGLSICYGIVNSVGGQIVVESQIGQGTTFRVKLPPASRGIAAGVPVVEKKNQTKVARVLVVEDEQMLLKLVRRILQSGDHDVQCAANGREALACIGRGEEFNVIVCDLMMPNMTGMELYQALFARDPDLARRMVFVTGGATTSEARDFLRSIPNLVVSKPFQKEALLEAVQLVLAMPPAELANAL